MKRRSPRGTDRRRPGDVAGHAPAREVMHRIVGEQCEALRRNGSADLSDLSFRVSAGVAAEVIGLTEGRGDLTRRIQRFFDDIPHGTARGLRGMREQSRAIGVNVAFYLRDIRPNVAARRRSDAMT